MAIAWPQRTFFLKLLIFFDLRGQPIKKVRGEVKRRAQNISKAPISSIGFFVFKTSANFSTRWNSCKVSTLVKCSRHLQWSNVEEHLQSIFTYFQSICWQNYIITQNMFSVVMIYFIIDRLPYIVFPLFSKSTITVSRIHCCDELSVSIYLASPAESHRANARASSVMLISKSMGISKSSSSVNLHFLDFYAPWCSVAYIHYINK